MTALAVVALVCAALPALLLVGNLRQYRVPKAAGERATRISVLIPARNEERSIEACVRSVLASTQPDLQVIVLDDHSTDTTAEILSRLAAEDGRLTWQSSPPLPAGWCGKQHACLSLARLATGEVLVFLDADVRLSPDALPRLVGFLEASGASLVSGVPQQETGTLLERMLIPLIHFLLLGFLPLRRMREQMSPAYGAGCGQLFVTWTEDYWRVGGHAAVRESLHDGLKLPRAYRSAGMRTDLFDATPLARCRMYRSAREVWLGLAKNATEGLAAPKTIVPATVLLVLGQVLPIAVLLGCLTAGARWIPTSVAAVATVLSYLPRALGAWRFRQSWLGVVLHPASIVLLLAIQWWALALLILRRPVSWKSRSYAPQAVAEEAG